MQQRTEPEPRRVLVVGGGVAALEAVLALRALAGMRVDVELIAPDADLRYPPLEVVEPFGLAPPRIELAHALATVGARQRRDTVTAVDVAHRRVRTATDVQLPYDDLVLAIGARALPPQEGALTFTGAGASAELEALIEQAVAGHVRQVLFAVPAGAAWPLPLYELAMLTVHRLRSAGCGATRVAISTPERTPLALFGERASAAVREQLDALGISFHGGGHVARILRGEVALEPGGERLPADRVITLPALRGPALRGVPHDADGFLPVDRLGAVIGADGVWAAGDATDNPIKQGGLATQQADAVASAIAARAGAAVTPEPSAGVLRGMLLTASEPTYLEAGAEGAGAVSRRPLWWPPAKVAGRWLAPLIAQELGVAAPTPEPPAMWRAGSVPCEIELPA